MFDNKTQVLVVDDMMTVRMVMVQCLADLGFTNVIQATNGQLAWDAITADNSQVGFVVSDWNMPKLTGVELVRLLRANKKYAQIPFLLATTESETTKVVEAVKAGVDDYVVKPFNVSTLKEKFENIYKKKAPK